MPTDEEPQTILSLAAWRKSRALDGQTARRPDGQTANAKGSSLRAGLEKITVRVPSAKGFRFKDFCKKENVEQAKLIEFFIDEFFARVDVGRPDGQTATIRSRDLDPDDLNPTDQRSEDEENIYQVSSNSDLGTARRPAVENVVQNSADEVNAKRQHLLAFYHKLTGNRPTPKDQQALEEVLAYPLHVIKSGIGKCVYFAKEPIRSFRYFLEEIHAFGAEDPGPEYYSQHIEKILIRVGRLQPPPPQNNQPTLPGTGAELIELDDHQRKDGTQ